MVTTGLDYLLPFILGCHVFLNNRPRALVWANLVAILPFFVFFGVAGIASSHRIECRIMTESGSISADVWEEAKPRISKLYQEEDWPLKLVIKKLRTDNFNPT